MDQIYPMVCENSNDIEKIEDQIFDWLHQKVKVHFIHLTHLNVSEGLNF